MKIHILNKDKMHPETLSFYESFANLTDYIEDADIVISSNFEPVHTDRSIIIATNTTGLDHIHGPNARVISLRDMDLTSFTAVPELCIGMAIFASRVHNKEELRGKTLGILGYGRIGKQLRQYAEALGMRVLWYDPFINPESTTLSYHDGERNLKPLLNESDIVSIHITADEENRNFINHDKLNMMKDGAILLNSSRPWIVDYKALSYALDNKLSAAWFDFDMPIQHPKLITTPHLGGTTKESTKRSEMLIAKRIKNLYEENQKELEA